MKKIILTILALTLLTTPVVSSASFASEPIPNEVISAEATEVSERIANDLITLVGEAIETLKEWRQKNHFEEVKPLKTYVALVVLKMQSKVEELRMRGLENSPLTRTINYCCAMLIRNCVLTGEDFDEARKILSSEHNALHPYELKLKEYLNVISGK